MASLERTPSDNSLFDFFDGRKGKPQNEGEAEHSKKQDPTDVANSGGFVIKEISLIPLSQDTPVDVDVMCISTTPRKYDETDLEATPEIKSTICSRSNSTSTSRASSVCNYSEDFSSCSNTPQNEEVYSDKWDAEDNAVEVEHLKCDVIIQNDEPIETKVNVIIQNDEPIETKVKCEDRISTNSPLPAGSVTSLPTSCKSNSHDGLNIGNPNTSKELTESYQCKISKNSTTSSVIGDQPRSIKSASEECLTGLLSTEKSTKNECRQEMSLQKEMQGEIETEQRYEANKIADTEGIPARVEKTDVDTTVQLLETETKDVKQETTKTTKSCVTKDLRDKISTKTAEAKKRPVKNRKPLARIDTDTKLCSSRNKHSMDMKSIATFGKTSNNNSKKRRKSRCTTNTSFETPGNDSMPENVVNVLQIPSNPSNTSDEFESYSDKMLMQSSTSGHSFNSPYSSSIHNSPYNSSCFSSLSRRSMKAKGLSLPSIDNTHPRQLVRGGTTSANSDSDIPLALAPGRRHIARKQSKPQVLQEHEIVAQKIGDYGKPRVPVKLKAEAILRDGQLEVSVTEKEEVQIGTNNLNVKITVVHKFIDPKPRLHVNTQQKITKRLNMTTNKDVIKQRAMWPSFNTHTNKEASERYYKCFG